MKEKNSCLKCTKLKQLMRITHLMTLFVSLAALMSSCIVIGAFIDDGAAKKPEVKVSHEEVMNSFTTKRDVITKYGMPTKKNTLEGIEIWFYDMGTTTETSGVAFGSGSSSGAAVAGFSSTSKDQSYVEFQFENDNVVHWRTKGLDYTEKTEGKRGNGGLIVGALIDIIVLVALASSAGL